MRKLALIALACTAAGAYAQSWAEVGDAPDGVPGHQNTVGAGALTNIRGVLNRAGGDHVDTYCIEIVSRSLFYATTKIGLGGSAVLSTGGNADTRLWLWNMNGGGLVGNDDINAFGTDTLASLISDPSTFGAFSGGEVVNATASAVVLNPGTYLLSISEFANDPKDAGNVDLFNLGSDFDALHGVNPQAGGFDHWENTTDSSVITYSIALQGTEFCAVPEPGSMIALGLGAVALLRRRKKKAA
jgi:hypothetical protein